MKTKKKKKKNKNKYNYSESFPYIIDKDNNCIILENFQINRLGKKSSKYEQTTIQVVIEKRNNLYRLVGSTDSEYDNIRNEKTSTGAAELSSKCKTKDTPQDHTVVIEGVEYHATDIHTKPILKTLYSHTDTNTQKPFHNCPFHESRKDLVLKIQNAFVGNYKVHAISGERGMGKTELAKEYANSCIETDGELKSDGVYKNIIFTTYSDNGLKDTIISLSCDGLKSHQDRYKIIMSLLKELEKPSLIIIDNVDYSDKNDLSELSEKSECYMDLINTGCHILLTTKTDLSNCYAIKQTRIEPHKSNVLVQLFFKIMFDIDEEDSNKAEVFIKEKFTNYNRKDSNSYEDYRTLVTKLINNLLMRNTYLVTIVAKLSKVKNPYDIFNALSSDNTNNLDDTVPVYKDGEQKEDTIMNLYYELFKISGITEDNTKIQLLYNLALLPVSGIKYDDFFDYSFKADIKRNIKKAFNKLYDSYYIFNNFGIISIHPFIREIVLTRIEKFDYVYVEKYASYITGKIDNATYDYELMYNLKLAVALYLSLKKIGLMPLTYAKLTACIANVYRMITNRQLAYQYGRHAIELLNLFDTSTLNSIDRLEKANCLNQAGYAVLQYKDAEDRITLAYNAISNAEIIINSEKSKLKQPLSINNKYDMLLTKVHGNLGACYNASQNYSKALEYHTQSKTYRESLVASVPSNANKNLLATSYRNIGNDYFYISKSYANEEEYNYLKLSYKNHQASSKLFETENDTKHYETIISNNRLIGTGIKLTKTYFQLFDQKKDINPPFEDIISNLMLFIDKTKKNITHMSVIGIIKDEFDNCLKNISSLLSLMEDRNISDDNMLTNITDAVDKASSIPDANSSLITESYDKINKIKKINKVMIKEINNNE